VEHRRIPSCVFTLFLFLLCAQHATAQVNDVPSPQLLTQRVFYAETAGIIWIIAELAILYGLLIAQRILDRPEIDAPFHLTPREWRRAYIWAAAVLVLTLALYARTIWVPPPTLLMTHPGTLYRGTRLFLSVHNAIWAAFVTAWIILEALIVYRGLRLYLRLKTHLSTPKEF